MVITKASLFMLATPLLLGAANASGNMSGPPVWWQVDDTLEDSDACVEVSYGSMGAYGPVRTWSGMRGSFSVAKKGTQMYLSDPVLQTEEDQEILSVCNANITDVMKTVVVTEACEQNGSEANMYVVESSFTVPCSEEAMATLPDGTELTRSILTNGSKNASMNGIAQGPLIDRVEGVIDDEEDDEDDESLELDNDSMETSRKLLHGDNGEEKKQKRGRKNQSGDGDGDGERKQYGKNGDGDGDGEKKQYGKNGEKKKGDGDGEKKQRGKNNEKQNSMSRKLLHSDNGEEKKQQRGRKNQSGDGDGDGERKQHGKSGDKRGDGERKSDEKQYGKNKRE